MRNAAWGYRNHLLGAAITASAAEAALGPEQMQNDQGAASAAWQTPAGVTSATFRLDTGAAAQFGAYGLFRSNLTPAATVRWRAGGPDSILARTALPTDTNAGASKGAATTRTGSATPPAGVATATAYTNTAGSSYVRAGAFQTTGGYLYDLSVWFRRVSGGAVGTGSVVVAEYQDEIGQVVRTGVALTAALLDGTWRLPVLRWRPGRDGLTTIYLAADTGALQYELGACSYVQWVELDTGAVSAGIVPGYGQTVLVPAAAVTAQIIRCDISDPTNPDGFLNVPLAYAGEAAVLRRNYSYGSSFGRMEGADEVRSRAGGLYGTLRWMARQWDVTLGGVGKDEAWPIVMELDAVARQRRNILFVPNPDSDNINREAIFGILRPSANIGIASLPLRSWRATLEERL